MVSDGGDRFLGTPRFDVVLRGYDRRQVDDHVARLQRVVARLRAELDVARNQQLSPPPMPMAPPAPSRGLQTPGHPPPAPRPRPTPRPRPDPPQHRPAPTPPVPAPDVVGGFTDRMQSILRTAEEEAAEIRRQARLSARGDDHLRSQIAGLVGERTTMLAELTRLRNQLDGLVPPPAARPNPQLNYGGGANPPPIPHSASPMARPGWGPAADQPPPGAPGPPTARPAPSMSRPPSPAALPRPAETDVESGTPVPDVELPAQSVSEVTTGRQGTQRFPEGSFRVPGDRADSLRSRSGPNPAPHELFHPPSEGAGEPNLGARQAGADGPAETSDGSDGEATVPASQHIPAAAPGADGAPDHDGGSANGSPDEPPADEPPAGEAQPGVTNGASRPASASWSG